MGAGRSVSAPNAVCKHRTNRVFVAEKVICYHQLLSDCVGDIITSCFVIMTEVISSSDTESLVRLNNNTDTGNECDQVNSVTFIKL